MFFLMIEFYSSHMLALYVSDLTGPSSGAFYYKLYVQFWYVVIRVLLDTSSRYSFVTIYNTESGRGKIDRSY